MDGLRHRPKGSQARGGAGKEGTDENAQGISGREMLSHVTTGSLVLGVRYSGRWKRSLLRLSGRPQASCGDCEARGHREEGLASDPGGAGPSRPRFPGQERRGWAQSLQRPSSCTLPSPSWAGSGQPGHSELGPSFALLVPMLWSAEDAGGGLRGQDERVSDSGCWTVLWQVRVP